MIFKITQCDFGFSYGGVNYDFTKDVVSAVINDPRETSLTRGNTGTDTVGIEYDMNISQPIESTITLRDLTKTMRDLIVSIYDSKARISGYIIDRLTGDNRQIKNAIIAKTPRQETIGEGEESVQLTLILRSFDVKESFNE